MYKIDQVRDYYAEQGILLGELRMIVSEDDVAAHPEWFEAFRSHGCTIEAQPRSVVIGMMRGFGWEGTDEEIWPEGNIYIVKKKQGEKFEIQSH